MGLSLNNDRPVFVLHDHDEQDQFLVELGSDGTWQFQNIAELI